MKIETADVLRHGNSIEHSCLAIDDDFRLIKVSLDKIIRFSETNLVKDDGYFGVIVNSDRRRHRACVREHDKVRCTLQENF